MLFIYTCVYLRECLLSHLCLNYYKILKYTQSFIKSLADPGGGGGGSGGSNPHPPEK